MALKGMKQVDMLLCGFDEGKGGSLYFIDYLASMQKLNVAGHGYGGMWPQQAREYPARIACEAPRQCLGCAPTRRCPPRRAPPAF